MKALALTTLIHQWAEQNPDRVAMRQKRFGIWQTITWKELHDRVESLARGLLALGMEPGDRVSVIGDNSPEWLIAEFAAMRLGGACMGIYQDMQEEELVYFINSSESRIVVGEDQEQVDKLVGVWDRIKENVIRVVVWDSRGMSHYFEKYPFLVHMDHVCEMGEKDDQAAEALAQVTVTPETIALMLPTSGATGLPKLSMISHSNMIAAAEAWQQVHPLYQWDEIFSLLPLAWMGEQLMTSRFLHTGTGYDFPESKQSVRSDFHEIQPTIATMSPKYVRGHLFPTYGRVWRMPRSSRSSSTYFAGLGLERAEIALEGKGKFGLLKEWLYSFCMFTTLRGLRQRVGWEG